MMRALPVLSHQAANVSAALVNCKDCTECCEHGGLVYVDDTEIRQLRLLGVPIIKVDGVSFIKRKPDGSCPMLDREHKKCAIYENRPMCCRLFPLDILSVENNLRWAISNDCPDERRKFSAAEDSDSRIGLGTVSLMTSILDSSLTNEDMAFFTRKENVSARMEAFDRDGTSWNHLVQCLKSEAASSNSLKMSETAKEKLRRKLEERKRRKKKEEEKRKKHKKDKGRKK